jgi:hypothetical protein
MTAGCAGIGPAQEGVNAGLSVSIRTKEPTSGPQLFMRYFTAWQKP